MPLSSSASAASVLHRPPLRPASAAGRSYSATFLTANLALQRLEKRPHHTRKPRRPFSAAFDDGANNGSAADCRSEIFALSQIHIGANEVEPTPQTTEPQTPPADECSSLHNWRKRGTDAWLAHDLLGAAEAFGRALEEDGWSLVDRLDMLRLRCAALLRLKKYNEALVDAHSAVDLMSGAAADGVPTETAQEIWHILGVALLATGNSTEAVDAVARALRLHSERGPHFDALCSLFLKAAATTPRATVPIDAYLPARRSVSRLTVSSDFASSSPTRRLGSFHPPAFRLVLRSKFVPWPLTLFLSRAIGQVKLSLFCAHRGTSASTAEPHTAIICTGGGAESETLVLIDVRPDGCLEVLANSGYEAWRTVEAMLPPRVRLGDFEVIAEGWRRDGRAPEAFAMLVSHEFCEMRESKSSAALEQQEAAARKQRRADELETWLNVLDLGAVAQILLKEGIDLESLQHLTDADLQHIGIMQLGDRRKLLAACQTQSTYKALEETIAQLEREKKALQQAADKSQALAARASKAQAEVADTVGTLRAELQVERDRNAMLEREIQSYVTQLQQERESSKKWLMHARAFATDSEQLQAQLTAFMEVQRSSVKESKDGLRRGLTNLIEKVHDQAVDNPRAFLGHAAAHEQPGPKPRTSLRHVAAAGIIPAETRSLDSLLGSSSKKVTFGSRQMPE